MTKLIFLLSALPTFACLATATAGTDLPVWAVVRLAAMAKVVLPVECRA
ncbi:hypothetical protein [Amycolatopsis jejuensis]|nr:hypothetical protein [Amycolatopsis jejuensis]